MPGLNDGDRRVLVILPALNEGARVASVIEEVRERMQGIEVLVIDDHSSDDTAEKSRQAGALVLEHPFHMGYGSALQTGYKYALRNGYKILAQLDADGQHDPAFLPRLVEPVASGRADVVVGSRYRSKGSYKAPFLKKAGTRLFAALASVLSRQKMTDPTSGFRALSERALKVCCEDTFPTDFPDADTLVHLKRAGLRIQEVPVEMRPSPPNHSMHQGLSQFYYVYKMLLSMLVVVTRGRAKKTEKEED